MFQGGMAAYNMDNRDLILATLLATVENLEVNIKILQSSQERLVQAERHSGLMHETNELLRAVLDKLTEGE